MVNPRERRRRRFWKPKSVYEHPEWPKKIAAVKRALPAYDQLPAPIRHAMSQAHRDFSAEIILDLWNNARKAMSETDCVRYIVDAIVENDRQLDVRDRRSDARMRQVQPL